MKKVSQQLVANILKVVLTIATFALLYSVSSCGSCPPTKCYPSRLKHSRQQINNTKAINRARKALDKKVYTNEVQYAFYNNEIIIFENNP